MSRLAGVVVCLVGLSAPALADPPARPQLLMNPVHMPPGSVPNVVNSHILYLNQCANGCTVHGAAQGASDSRTDSSDIGSGTLTKYAGGASRWSQIMTCVQGVMSPFNITVTDVDPGSADHFEVMVAGSACQILQGTIGSQCQFVGGIADFAFSGYIPNALVFDFSDTWNGDVTEDCATIAQEIAHAWGLDHTIQHSDPMTYNQPLTTPLKYQNNATCGSDCQLNGASCQDPYNGATCTGTCGQIGNSNATHPCLSGSGSSTQNEVDMLTALFGPAGAQAPTLTITSPAAGSAVQSGFEVDVTCTSGDGIQEIDFSFDGVQKASLTSSPAKFNAPTGLKDGSHTFSVLCATNKQATATAMESVIVGEKCSTDADCMMNYICYQQACIAGPNATGGLGDPCTKNSDCQSNTCASDGTMMACVVPCSTSNDQCPSGTGCLGVGTTGTAGVCFPGAAHGDAGGCCEAGHDGGPAGPLLLSGTIAALWITRRRTTNRAKS